MSVGPLLEYIKNQKDKEKLDKIMHENDRFRSVDSETASLINTVTGSRLKFDIREEKVDMCKAIDDMRKESKEEGRSEGRVEGIESVKVHSPAGDGIFEDPCR